MLSRKLTRPIAAVAAAFAVAGGAYGIVSATASSSSATATTTSTTTSTASPRANARSGPAAGGTIGTVATVSASNFTVSTPAGQTVIVVETSSTRYAKGTSIKSGKPVLVLGTTDGTTITATQVIAQPTPRGSATVIPFQRGAASTSKQVGQIPGSYTQGSGTIVGGMAANKATEAALASYAGGIVDRVVKLSTGSYEVHNIGVNWPHHIFVSKTFKVIGAD